MQVYRARNPRKSPLWQCAHRHYDAFEEAYPEQYQPRYGHLRPVIPEVVHKFLECGDLTRGFARIRCDHCQHEYLLAFSCKSRWFCPSCHHLWKHSGFNLHAGERVPPEAKADLEDLAQYILRNPFSVEKMNLESPGDIVIYRSRLNAKINRNFEVFTPTDFLAAITQHIPDKGAQMVRYYGWYSNKMRGVRQRGLPAELVFRRPGVSPPPPAKLPSKRWRDLILRVWHVDPLRCPVCQSPMRVIAVIDDPRVVEQILRHLGACHDPPPRPPPQDLPGPYTYEPCDDVDPAPDYENVLTD